MKRWKWRASLSGAVAGLANGLFGAGGGMLLVPLLTRRCGLTARKSFATALCIIFPLCLISLLVYSRSGVIPIRQAAPMLLGGFLGGLGGGALLKYAPVRLLHGVLGAIIVWGGIRLWL